MKIVSIGGGPAGLYFALLMKKADPAHDVTVVERNRADDTFGFGVVFCPRCGGRRRIVGVYPGGQRLREVLERLGLGDRSSRPAPEPSG